MNPWIIAAQMAAQGMMGMSQTRLSNMQFYHQQVMDNYQTRQQNQSANYQSDRQYLHDLYAARREYALGRYQAEALSLQGQADKAYAEHQEAMSEANAQRERMNLQHQADMARINANIALLGKTAVRAAGDHAIARYSLQAGNAKAAMRAGLAANGVVLDEGSTQELMDTADLMRSIDINSLQNNAINEAFGYENRAQDLRNQAAMFEANKATIHGEYFGSKGIRTQYSAPMDLSPYVSRTPVTEAAEMPVYKSSTNLFTGFVRSMLGGATDFAQSWYSSRGNNAARSNPYASYGIGMGPNSDPRFAVNSGKLRWGKATSG